MIVGPFLASSKKLKFFVFKIEFGRLGLAISVFVAFNEHKYDKTNQCILVYLRKVQNSARVDMSIS